MRHTADCRKCKTEQILDRVVGSLRAKCSLGHLRRRLNPFLTGKYNIFVKKSTARSATRISQDRGAMRMRSVTIVTADPKLHWECTIWNKVARCVQSLQEDVSGLSSLRVTT